MSIPANTPEKVSDYFRVKAKQLAALADLPICEHSGLSGSHREQIQRIYLREILPKQFEIGRGMIYGPEHRSHEADIVVWDAAHYAALPLSEHAFYFAESVRAVIECKSRWSNDEFRDVLEKTNAIQSITKAGELNVADEIEMLWEHIDALENGSQGGTHPSVIRPPIGTASLFLTGGSVKSIEEQAKGSHESLDESWPDIVVCLSSGILALKDYQRNDLPYGRGRLNIFDFQEDALFAFTCAVLALVARRTVQVEGLIDLWRYFPTSNILPVFSLDFATTLPGRRISNRWKGLFHFEP